MPDITKASKVIDLSQMTYGGSMSLTITPNGTGSGWFGPLAPLAPTAPREVAGRQFDIPSGFNLRITPRQGEAITFDMLRGLADSYDLLRVIIESRKDQVRRMGIKFRARDGMTVSEADLEKVRQFFLRPDGEHDFETWIGMLLEDLLVVDAACIYRQRDMAGNLLYLSPMDGATIKRIVDDWGRTPMPYEDPNSGDIVIPPAYQQVLKGMQAVDYSVQDLIYAPRNVRAHRVYGYSPVEQIIMTVQIALRRQLGTLEYYTEGNIPSALIGVPDNWTPDMIKQFQDYWDAYFEGDTARRRKAKFVPGGVAKTFIATREPELKNLFDEWLAKICCYAFSVSPQPFVSQVNRATADTQKMMAEEEGLFPILNWIKNLVDPIILHDLGVKGVECILEEDEKDDPDKLAVRLVNLTNNATITRNEARERMGLEASPDPEAYLLGFTGLSGFIPLSHALALEQQQASLEMNQAFAPEPAPGDTGPPGKSKSAVEKLLDDYFDKFEKFDPSEPRDDHGRWTEGAGSTADGHKPTEPQKPGAGQPRNHHGQFGSTGQPTARERKKTERKHHEDPRFTRDDMGRFHSAPPEGFISISKKVVTKIFYAGLTIAGTYAAMRFLNSRNPQVAVAVRREGEKLAKWFLRGAANHAIGEVLKMMGFDPRYARMASTAIRHVLEALLGSKFGKIDPEQTHEDTEFVQKFAAYLLPLALQRASGMLLASLEERDTNPESMEIFREILTQQTSQLCGALSSLGKSEAELSLQKRAATRPIPPLLQYRMYSAQRAAVRRKLADGLSASRAGLRQLIVSRLSVTKNYVRAAGVMMTAPSGKVLFVQRSSESDSAGTWALPGGGIEHSETPQQAVIRECDEEIGFSPMDYSLTMLHTGTNSYQTFAATVDEEFEPTLNSEHTAYAWAYPMTPPEPLHPGVRDTLVATGHLDKLAKASDDDEAARIARDADLSSIRRIEIGDDLADVSGDSALRVLVRLGVGEDSDTMDQAISSSEALSRRRAESIVGDKAASDDGYSVEQSSRDTIESATRAGLERGDSPETIADEVSNRVLGEDRAQAITDSEVDSASTAGSLESLRAARDAGLSVMKSWLTADDDRVDEDICRANEDQGPIPIDEPFQSGHMAPLGHPNCRCALVPHVIQDDVSSEDQQ